ncbi:hypothetical protein, partial [Streptomyces sp. SID3343]|uniref:hypothetical protein n=1 Tax=Streptomyces sp. SID3343 TaxID=2690260 RepID=UPI001369A9D9
MPERPENERRRIDVNAVQVGGSALAAISSAFLLSTLGVAGTVIGAALASVVATVGSAVYVHLFRKTGEQLRDVRAQLVPTHEGGPRPDPAGVPDRPTGVADLRPPTDETVVLPVGEYEPADHPTDGTAGSGSATGSGPRPDEAGGKPVWLVRSIVAAVIVFVVAMAAVTLTETALGRSFASLFGHGDKGGSTISRIVDDKPAAHESPKKPADPTPGSEHSADPKNSHNPADDENKGKDTSGGAGGASTPSPTSTPSSRPSNSQAPQPGGGSTPSNKPTTPPRTSASTGAGQG